MRIQHNIMAMNAYRNYTNNVSAMKANLEKLSSGYKINRAGDDAAGLAISEKMRAQITGLQQAQANAKSGINLVQTAEGALTEVHDMLNRMVKLADQSANGTYDDTTDRNQLQKEINQLLDEINRIADSANFNGIKLLDGSMNADDIVNVKDPTIIGQDAFDIYSDLWSEAPPKTNFEAQLHKEATGSAKTSFEIDFNDLSLTATDDGKVNYVFALTRTGDEAGHKVAAYQPIDFEAGAGEEISGADLAAKIADAYKDDGIDINFTQKMASISGAGDVTNAATPADTDVIVNYSVRAEGTKLIFEMSDKGYAVAAGNAEANANGDDTFKVGDKTYNAVDGTDKNYDPFQGNFSAFIQTANTLNSTKNLAATNIVRGGISSGKQLAQTLVNMGDVITDAAEGKGKVRDGSGIKVGDEYYVFASSDKTLNAQYGDNVKVVDIRDLVDKDSGKFKDAATLNKELGGTGDGFDRAITRLTEAGKDNKMFSLEQDYVGTLALTEKAGYNGDGKDGRADLTTEAGLKAQIQKFTGVKANVETIKASGKALTLQIGDTSESFNQLKVNIADMHAAALGIAGIDISNQDSAAAAVDKIRAAINKVSDVRGTLGATQNRLDHTINNLSVMTENIQDAESTIRDVDVAEEMMAYTKNNILIQSAQAMLAQANQVPQGVLQLLQ